MAKLKLFSTIFSKLSSLTKKDGQIIISKDSQSLYIDIDGERVEITDWVDINTEEELLATLSPLTNKFYYTKDTHKIWRYINSKWEKLNIVVTWGTIEGKPDNIIYTDDIADNLTTYDSNKVLSANQGATLGSSYNKISNIVGDDIAEYSENSTYKVGDYCMYLGTLFKCISAINTPIAFDGSNHWKATTLSTEVKELNSNLEQTNSKLGGLAFKSQKVAKTRSGDQYPQVIQVVVANAKNKAIFITPDTGNTAEVPNIVRIDRYENTINIVFNEALQANTTYYLDMLIIG